MNEIISSKENITRIFHIRSSKEMLDFHLSALNEFEALRELIEKKKEPLKPVGFKTYDK